MRHMQPASFHVVMHENARKGNPLGGSQQARDPAPLLPMPYSTGAACLAGYGVRYTTEVAGLGTDPNLLRFVKNHVMGQVGNHKQSHHQQ